MNAKSLCWCLSALTIGCLASPNFGAQTVDDTGSKWNLEQAMRQETRRISSGKTIYGDEPSGEIVRWLHELIDPPRRFAELEREAVLFRSQLAKAQEDFTKAREKLDAELKSTQAEKEEMAKALANSKTELAKIIAEKSAAFMTLQKNIEERDDEINELKKEVNRLQDAQVAQKKQSEKLQRDLINQNKEPVYGGLTVNQWTEIARDKTSSRREEAIRVLATFKWIEVAREKTSSHRGEAIRKLGMIQPAAIAAIPTLVEALEDKSVRDDAAWALSQMDSAVDEIVPQLLEAVKDKSTLPCACSVLGKLGPSARSAVPALLKIAEGTDPKARDQASYALGSILPDSKFAAWSILRDLGTPPENDSISRASISSLAQSAPEAVVAACEDVLTRETPRLRLVALDVLTHMAPKSVIAGPVIAKALDDKDRVVRKSAAFALMRLGVHERLPIRTLAIGLKDEDVEVRVYSAAILRRAGAEAREALPALMEALADQDAAVRGQAAFALAAIGPPAVPRLIEALKGPSVDTRRLAVFALGKIGPEAATARPALTLLLKDADAEVRMVAAESLRKINQETGR